MAETGSYRDRLAVLERLMAQTLRLRASSQESMVRPSQVPSFAVVATYFVLDLDSGGGVEWFIVHTLSKLVPQLLHNTEQQPVMYRGQVRGRVRWPATFKARSTDDYDPTRYVCHEVRQRYDTPENQLVKYVMVQLTAVPGGYPGGYPPRGMLPSRQRAASINRYSYPRGSHGNDAPGLTAQRPIARDYRSASYYRGASAESGEGANRGLRDSRADV